MTPANLAAILDPSAPDSQPFIIELDRDGEERRRVSWGAARAEIAALAMSGSSTQSKIQAFPGDGDFFQRLNIKAPTRTEACRILAKVLRDNAIERASGPTYQFMEAKWSLWPFDCVKDGQPQKKGGPISWTPAEVFAGAGGLAQAITEEFGTFDQTPHPSLTPAWEAEKQPALNGLADDLAAEVDKTAKRQARKLGKV